MKPPNLHGHMMADRYAVVSTDGVKYTPFINEVSCGYKAEFDNGRVEYIYLVPSTDSDDGVATVFAYHGTEGDPSIDGADIHWPMGVD